MDPERVLTRIEEKETISVIEAERGVLASLLRAERRQVERHPGAVEETFGQDLSDRQVEDVLRSEFQDLVQDVKGKRRDVTPEMLDEAISKLDERVGVDAWDDDIVREHRETCKTVIDRSETGRY